MDTNNDIEFSSVLHSLINHIEYQRAVITTETTPAGLVQDDNGSTPLNVSLSWATDETILLLLEAFPEAASLPNKWGHSPLFTAVRHGRSSKIIKYLLRVDPSQIHSVTNDGETPLRFFFQRWNIKLRTIQKSFRCSPSILDLVIEDNRKVRDIYEQTSHLLQATTSGSITKGEYNTSWFPLHSSLYVKLCPHSFFRLLLLIHPEHVMERDDSGNLPIHIIASSSSEINTDGTLYECWECKKRIVSDPWHRFKNNSFQHYCHNCFERKSIFSRRSFELMNPVHKAPSVIIDLLRVQPLCTQVPNGNERLPLHMAIEKGHDFVNGKVVELLYKSAPRALTARDAKSHMLPFMIAAVGRGKVFDSKNDEYLLQFSSCFGLLIEDVNLILFGKHNSKKRTKCK